MNFRSQIICLSLISAPFIIKAQDDTVQIIEEMSVAVAVQKIEIQRYRNQNEFLDEKDIRSLATNDVGELLSKFAGVYLKAYGGLGGLKTVSVRSMGSTHNNTVIDGFTESNSQTGQTNLGRIQSDNVIGIMRTTGEGYGYFLPVSSQAAGSNVFIQTFENTFDRDSLMIRANLKYGSFGQKSTYLGAKINRKKFFVSAFGRYRDAKGDYEYDFLNGNTWQNGKRSNNDYQDYYFGGGIGYMNQRVKARIGFRSSASNQGLPGAVIFYNESADERLTTRKQTGFGDVSIRYEKTDLRFYANADLAFLNYSDPTYLNEAESISSNYRNQSVKTGFIINQRLGVSSSIRGGIEHAISSLEVDDSAFARPLRNHVHSMLGYHGFFDGTTVSAVLFSQFVDEFNRNGSEPDDLFRLNPFLSITTKATRKRRIKHRIWYRNSFRMPSFNELYYNNIGNEQLLPESAHQFNYGFEIVPWKKKIDLHLRSNLFVNLIENKILAIPTKNLFVWSMQNVTNARIFGGELFFDFEWKKKDYSTLVSGNYTYQKVIDVTEGSLNYGDQIAYSPEHIASLDITEQYKGWGLRVSNSITSMRYSLNENVEANEIPSFYLLDVSLSYTHQINKNEFRIQLNAKNMLNESYAYVRSFVMPGRNFLITLSYAFN